MKTLTIIRHAKSSWDYLGLSDYDRPLAKRGKKDIPKMGDFLQKKGLSFSLVISSSANRALATAMGLSAYLGYKEQDIKLYRSLFHAVEGEILEVLNSQHDEIANILLFGHNPGLTSFVNRYGDQYIDNIPTTGVVSLEFNVDRWSEIASATGRLVFFHYPKGINS